MHPGLCNFYYNLLKKKKLLPILKSLRIFYIVKIHPEYYKKYRLSFYEITKKFIYKAALTLSFYFEKFFSSNKKNISKKKILIISHLLNENHLKNSEDFYFGKLGRILMRKKNTYQFLLINHTKVSSQKLNNQNKNKNNKWVVDKLLSIKYETYLLLQQIKAFIWVFSNKKIFRSKISFGQITLSLFNNETKFSLRSYLMIKEYLKIIEPEYLITTFEGFPWEREIFRSTKEFDKNIKTIGYQQVFLNENYKSIFFKLSNNRDPEIIWTLDSFSKNLFLKSDLKKKKINVIGNLKFQKRKKFKCNFKKYKNNILVIPEGIESECIKLFKTSLEVALKEKNLNFIWRVHPVINMQDILKKMKLGNYLPLNINISREKNLNKDLSKCKFVFYRGSAVAIEAVNLGLVPIYLNQINEPNIDILRSHKKKSDYINNSKQFLLLIKKYSKKNMPKSKISFRKDAEKINIRELNNLGND